MTDDSAPAEYVYVPKYPFLVKRLAFTRREPCPDLGIRPGLSSSDEDWEAFQAGHQRLDEWNRQGGRIEVTCPVIVKVEGKLDFPTVTRTSANSYITDPPKELGTLTAFYDFGAVTRVDGEAMEDFSVEAYPLVDELRPWERNKHRVVVDGQTNDVMNDLFDLKKEGKGRFINLKTYAKHRDWTGPVKASMIAAVMRIGLSASGDARVSDMVHDVRNIVGEDQLEVFE